MDENSRQRFQTHQWLAYSLARQYARRAPRWVSRDEVESAAMEGLWAAAEAFDPDRGVRFSTFAYGRVAGQIMDWLRRVHPFKRSLREMARRGERTMPRLLSLDAARSVGIEDRPADDTVAAALRAVNPISRLILRLRYWEHYDFRAIAAVWNKSEAWAWWKHENAIQYLRDRYANHE